MAKEAIGRVRIITDAKGFHTAMRKMSWEAQTFQGKMMAVGGQMKSVGRTMTLGVTTPIVAGLALSVKAAQEENKQMEVMAKLLKTNAKATDEQVAAMERWISKQQSATNFSDGELRPAVQSLVVATGDLNEAQDLTGLAMDIAAAKGKPVAAVAEAISKAYNGNVGALGRLGVATRDAEGKTLSFAEATEAAQKRYQGAAKTAADPFTQAKNAIADASEELGRVFTPIVVKLAEKLKGLAEWFNGLSSRSKKFIGVLLVVAAAIGPLLIIFGSLISLVATLSTVVMVGGTAMTLFGAIIAALTSPITLTIAAIVAIGVALVVLYKKNETFRKIVTRAWEVIKKVGVAVWAVIKKALGLFWADMKLKFALMKKAISVLKVAFNGISRVATAVWDRVSGAFRSGYINTVAWINKMIDKINWLLGKIGVAKIANVTTGAPPQSTSSGYTSTEKRGDSIFGTGRKPGTGDAGGIYDFMGGDLWGMLSKVLPDMPALPPVLSGVPKAVLEKVKKYIRGLFSGGGSLGAIPGGAGYAWAYALAKRFGLSVTSTFRPGAITASGNMSNHGIYGKAADFAGPAGRMMALANALFGSPGGFSEIIYQHRGYSRGSNYYFPRNDHFDHVHVARGDSAGGSGVRPSGGGSLNVNVVMPGGSTIIGTSGEVARILAPMISREVAKQNARANRRR